MAFEPTTWSGSTQNITIDKSKISSDLYNFPACIHINDSSGTSNYDMSDVMTHLTTSGVDSNTSLLYSFNNGDISDSTHNVTYYGNPIIGYGTTVTGIDYYMSFDGTGDYLNLASHADWEFGWGDFTIDFWVNSSVTSNERDTLFKIGITVSPWTTPIQITIGSTTASDWSTGGTYLGLHLNYTTSWGWQGSSTTSICDGAWHHIAVVKQSAVTKAFIDGVEEINSSYNHQYITNLVYIGGNDASRFSNSKLTAIRVTKGEALWFSNFSSNLPIGPYTTSANTKLLLNFEGDKSFHKHSINNAGTVTSTTSFGKFEGSTEFNGSSTYQSITDSTNIDFGTGDFTIDAWVNLDTVGTTQRLCAVGSVTSAGDGQWCLGMGYNVSWGAGTRLNFAYRQSGSVTDISPAATDLTADSWHHIALTRNNGVLFFFLDGTLIYTANCTATIGYSSQPFYIGCRHNGTSTTEYADGNIDELQVLSGISKWTGNFTPPKYKYGHSWHNRKKIAITTTGATPEQLYTEISHWGDSEAYLWVKIPEVLSSLDTKLKFYYDKNHQDSDYVDHSITLLVQDSIKDCSSYNHDFSITGSPSQNYYQLDSYSFNSSVFFNGTDTYLYTAYDSNLDFSTNPFTVEFWIILSKESLTTTTSIIGKIVYGQYYGWLIRVVNGVIKAYTGTSSWHVLTCTETLVANKLYHVAFVRTVTSRNFYINGVLKGSDTYIDDVNKTTSLVIGRFGTTEYFKGYLAGVAVHYTARYTSNFTPSTTFTNDSYTRILLPFDNFAQNYTPATIIEESSYEFEFTNDSQKVSGISYWWANSIYFNGSSAIYTTQNPILNIGTNDFTIEFWINFDDNNARRGIFNKWNAGANKRTILFCYNFSSNQKFRILFSSDGSGYTEWLTGVWTPVVDRLYHIALVRYSTNFYLYIDGTLLSSFTGFTSAFYESDYQFNIGLEDAVPSSYFKGLISNFKIATEALWTTDFTVVSGAYNINYVGDIGSAQASHVWDNNYVSVYHMNEDPSIGGECIVDSTNRLNYGTPQGSMTSGDLVASNLGYSLDLDGTDDCIHTAYDSSLDILNKITIEAIIKPTVTGTDAYIVSRGDYNEADTKTYEFSKYSGDKLRFIRSGGTPVYSNTTISATQLSSVAVTYNSTLTSGQLTNIFIDGINVTDTANNPSGAMSSTSDGVTIGRSPATSATGMFNGLVNEVRISNKDRSEAWIKSTSDSILDDLFTFSYPIYFIYSNPIPIHASIAYGKTKQLYLNVDVSVSGVLDVTTYNATFYDGLTDYQLGNTVSGLNFGTNANISIDTPSGIDYYWYVQTVSTDNEINGQSSTYYFSNRFLCSGTVYEGAVSVSGSIVRLHRRSNGAVVGSTTVTGVDGSFTIDSTFNEEHYAVALHPNSNYNALIYDRLVP